RAAPAKIGRESMLDLFDSRLGFLCEERFSRHDHAIRAVTALRGLLGDEGRLHRIGGLRRSKSFKRCNWAAFRPHDWRHAGARRLAVDQHGTCAALPEPAPELRTV